MTAKTVRRPCPVCDRGASDRALAVTTDERGTVEYCHRCGYRQADNHDNPLRPRPAPDPISPDHPKPNLESIWRRTRPLRGTIGEAYLRNRHCVIPPADGDLRFLPGGKYPPSLCALVTNAASGRPQSLHFTRLAPDGSGKAGTARDKVLLRGHPKKGGCIRLWPDDAVSDGLGIAEGIESALSAAHGFTPMWATIDAGNLADFPILEGVDTLMIFADYDDAGLHAARLCSRRWTQARIVIPPVPGTDLNDVVTA